VVDQDHVRVWAARLAAPAAFFLAAIVLVLLVQNAISSNGGNEATPASTVPTTTTGSGTTTTAQNPRRKRFYRVRGGDTLESIATRFATTVEDLIRLNPGIDPLALSPGQKLRIYQP
jgi:LysM repeat protein